MDIMYERYFNSAVKGSFSALKIERIAYSTILQIVAELQILSYVFEPRVSYTPLNPHILL